MNEHSGLTAIRNYILVGLLSLTHVGIMYSQTYTVGDTLPDLNGPICANGEGNFSLYDYNGSVNGGDYSVVWIVFFAAW